jgi:glycosyltransferase involved in cell wall biosynthesis
MRLTSEPPGTSQPSSSMRILFCSPAPLSRKLGMSKVLLELGATLLDLGWQVDTLSLADLPRQSEAWSVGEAALALRDHLRSRAGFYDVVDYDHVYLPFPRGEFDPDALLVARSALLAHHLQAVIPPLPGARRRLGYLLKARTRETRLFELVASAQKTLEAADYINVNNDDAKETLCATGILPSKIGVFPCGLTSDRLRRFSEIPSRNPNSNLIAFVGTFDARKGAADMPAIVALVTKSVPGARFRFLGTRGMLHAAKDVLRLFPRRLRGSLEVIPDFEPEDLPKLLAPCSVGMFPSYVEGFGLGVLEMLAASVPVICYRSPGPTMLVKGDWVVERGDVRTMADKIAMLLRNSDQLTADRRWAKKRSRDFRWKDIGKQTSEKYLELLRQKSDYR